MFLLSYWFPFITREKGIGCGPDAVKCTNTHLFWVLPLISMYLGAKKLFPVKKQKAREQPIPPLIHDPLTAPT